jgi:predicted membrane-bound spermidine synthase
VVVAVALAEAALVSALLLLAPLRMLSRREEKVSFNGTVFFFGIGAGFMFGELLFVYLGTFFMGEPVVSLTFTLAATLVSSGLGGLWAGRRNRSFLRASLAVAPLVLSLTAGGLMAFSPQVLALPAPVRGIVLLLAVALPGFLMGMPFPTGMRDLAQSPSARSYAWAANGCAAVLASILSAQIAISAGFAWLLAAAAAAYGAAFLSLWRTPLTIDIKKQTVMHGR